MQKVRGKRGTGQGNELTIFRLWVRCVSIFKAGSSGVWPTERADFWTGASACDQTAAALYVAVIMRQVQLQRLSLTAGRSSWRVSDSLS